MIKFLGGGLDKCDDDYDDDNGTNRWSSIGIEKDSWSNRAYFVVWATRLMRDSFESAVDQSNFFKQAFEGNSFSFIVDILLRG